jgi:hypothetical protein
MEPTHSHITCRGRPAAFRRALPCPQRRSATAWRGKLRVHARPDEPPSAFVPDGAGMIVGLIAIYAIQIREVNPSIAFFLAFSIMEVLSRG